MGSFPNYFQDGAVLYVKTMHAGLKPPEPVASLVSLSKSPAPMAIRACREETVNPNGDILSALGTASQTGEFHGRVAAGYVLPWQCSWVSAGETAITIGGLPCTGIAKKPLLPLAGCLA